MKTILFAILVMSVTQHVDAQDSVSASNPSFIVLYTIAEKWDNTKPPHEQAYFKEHSAHLSQLRTAGVIVTGARYSDTGMIVLRARDEAEAREIVTRDEAIRNRLFKAEVFLLKPFYKGCLE